jgi:hypothetical protein
MERAGWSSGVFSAVKLNQSDSISGPSATSKPMRAENRLDALQRERHRVQTTLPALAAWQAHVQRFGFELGLQLGICQAWRRSVSAASMACLARLMAAPRDFFSSTLKRPCLSSAR